MESASTFDYVVIAVYFLCVAAIGLWAARRKKKTTDDYFLASRRMPGWIVGFAVVGTVISSVSFVAHPGAAFARNWWLVVPNLMVLYTLVGGLEAVVYTDVLQGFVMTAGALSVLLIILFRPEGGPSAVISTAYAGGKFGLGDFTFSANSFFGAQPTFWILSLSGILHFGRSYMTEPNMVQRYLMARSDREAQRGVMAGALSCVPIWLTLAFIGSCLWAFYQLTSASIPPEVLAKPDNILPYFISTQLPPGLVGLILAAILSACNSSVSSDLNSVGTVVTQDYYIRGRPNSSEKSRLLFGRCAVSITGLLCILVALILISARAKAMIELIVTLGMIFSGGMLGLFALGFFSTRATRRGAYIGTTICLVFILWATLTGPLKIDLGMNFNMHPIMIGVLSHFILFISGYLASILFRGERSNLSGLTIWTGKSEIPSSKTEEG